MRSSQPALPTNRAFVMQFRPPKPDGSPAYEGRVEHLVSGQEAHFHSQEELLAFMIDVLIGGAATNGRRITEFSSTA